MKYWREKAHESLESATDEFNKKRLSFAVNRIYYACFYILTAVFLERNKTFRTHKGLRAALHKNLIKEGVIDQKWGKFFDEVFESRQRGDYIPIANFESAQVESYLKQAREFVEEVNRLLMP